jgi:putative peptide zinc metalloprotease protein
MPQVPHAVWPAERMRTVPAATRQLPSAALGTVGGGQIATDPTDRGGTATIESLFELELALPEDAPRDFLGSRVEVRFTHAPEPIGLRWLRGLRRAFLSWFQA